MLTVVVKKRNGFRYQIFQNGRAGTPIRISPFLMCGTCRTNQASAHPACKCENRYHCGHCAPAHRKMCVSAGAPEGREGLWFLWKHDLIWFSPRQLRAAQADGRFHHGSSNWELHPPSLRLEWARKKIEDAQKEYDQIAAEIEEEKRRA